MTMFNKTSCSDLDLPSYSNQGKNLIFANEFRFPDNYEDT